MKNPINHDLKNNNYQHHQSRWELYPQRVEAYKFQKIIKNH